jgi:hypothetical protein
MRNIEMKLKRKDKNDDTERAIPMKVGTVGVV